MTTDHGMVLGELTGEWARRHHRYCKNQDIWPISAAKGVLVQEGYSHFSDLENMVKKTSRKTIIVALWISGATWRLAYQRAVLGRTHTVN